MLAPLGVWLKEASAGREGEAGRGGSGATGIFSHCFTRGKRQESTFLEMVSYSENRTE